MQGELDADGLAAAAADLLERSVAPALAGEARFHALMALAALRMAERERALHPRLQASETAVLAAAGVASHGALREGLRSGGFLRRALHEKLLADAALRTSVTKPSALTDEERALIAGG